MRYYIENNCVRSTLQLYSGTCFIPLHRVQVQTPDVLGLKYIFGHTVVSTKIDEFSLPFAPAGMDLTREGDIIVCSAGQKRVSVFSQEVTC